MFSVFKRRRPCYDTDMEQLDANRISALLQLPGVRVETYAVLPSTNDACCRILGEGAAECLVLAEMQTGGRGRRGRTFFSPPGGLYMSIGMRASPDETGLTCRAAAAAAETVARVTGIECGVKWVNDLVFRGKKVCGILAEQTGESAIVGIGINLIPAPLPPDLADRVGFLDCGDVREELAAGIARALLRRDLSDRSFMDAYRSRSVVIGREIICLVGARSFPARAVAIDDDGGLVIDGPNGRETLRWGEVSIRL